MPKDGGEAVQVTRAGGHRSFASPDGKWIYYRKLGQQGLFRMPPEGGDEKRVFGGSIEGWANFGVTRKGVYFMTGGTIQLLDEATGKVSTVAALDKPGGQITVSSDDGYIVWMQVDRNTQDLMLVENFR